MKGFVDRAGRALLSVELQSTAAANPLTLAVWIDTGFTGDLVLPQNLIDEIFLPQSGTVGAVLADGSQVALRTYTCLISWFGQQRRLEVVANDGEYPLLGVGLLADRELRIDYRSKAITLV
jgi:clan AA aspartic protease